MKKLSLLAVAFFCGFIAFAAELPDFSKAETWKKAGWSKSVYTRGENGVLIIERSVEGSGAWCTAPFAATVGEKLSGTIEVAYLNKVGKGSARMGFNFLDASGKRVLFRNVVWISGLTGEFVKKGFSFKVPEGAVKVAVYVCLDGVGKAEFRNLEFKK